jgi:hypothetical protein
LTPDRGRGRGGVLAASATVSDSGFCAVVSCSAVRVRPAHYGDKAVQLDGCDLRVVTGDGKGCKTTYRDRARDKASAEAEQKLEDKTRTVTELARKRFAWMQDWKAKHKRETDAFIASHTYVCKANHEYCDSIKHCKDEGTCMNDGFMISDGQSGECICEAPSFYRAGSTHTPWTDAYHASELGKSDDAWFMETDPSQPLKVTWTILRKTQVKLNVESDNYDMGDIPDGAPECKIDTKSNSESTLVCGSALFAAQFDGTAIKLSNRVDGTRKDLGSHVVRNLHTGVTATIKKIGH